LHEYLLASFAFSSCFAVIELAGKNIPGVDFLSLYSANLVPNQKNEKKSFYINKIRKNT